MEKYQNNNENNNAEKMLQTVDPTEIPVYRGKDERVLDAFDDGSGHLFVSFAKPAKADRFGQYGNEIGHIFEITNGFYATKNSENTASGKDEYQVTSYGINIDNVKKVSGNKNETFFIKDYLKEHGFKFNGSDKTWVRR